jgi:hypothetical protein
MITGKGMWIWIVQRCGEPTAIAAKAKAGGISHMLIKLADGPYAYYGNNYGDTGNRDWTMQMVQACKAVGIDPVCWQYVYGVQPIAEANKVIERMNGAGIKKLVIDAEVEYKAPGMGAKAVQYCQRLHTLMPDIALGLASYRFPTLHRELPWAEFGQFMDCYVPQVYWQGSHNPVEQLGRCIREYAKLPYPNKPIFPAGSAYREHGWQPNPGEVTAFLASAKDVYGITAANLWEWYDATIRIPEYWNNEISVFDYGEQPDPPLDWAHAITAWATSMGYVGPGPV